ncbi:hypothetical protein AOC36_08590 [Erysipelothrix larvae]|uniref:GLUG domain-containing protein n=1 Tax=Erysipelothrix larvae TaxID=1514105 RepID=A0A0X8H0Y5_9FIRM|nr:hypothetical protein [Erysipelothrix larvae]AMC94042.1 hypothetical protein AOC36_08590 [Erysipelothrix larvae]
MTPFKEIKKVLLKLIICFTLIIFSVSTQITQISADDTHDFAGGTGTRSDPYQIETVDHLDNVRKYLNQTVYFQLNNDIDLTTFLEDKPAGWNPIGTVKFNSFSGHFDGKGHSVTGLWFKQNNAPTNDQRNNIGLFGYTQDATITNLGVETNDTMGGINIIDDEIGLNVGILAGYSIKTKISNCYSKGKISISSYYINVGGLLGKIEGSEVLESYSDVNLRISDFIFNVSLGGLIGTSIASNVLKSFAIGRISDEIGSNITGNVGGFIGTLDTANLINAFSDNYSNMSVSTTNSWVNVGGFAGLISSGRIQKS